MARGENCSDRDKASEELRFPAARPADAESQFTVYIVDDDPAILQAMELMLKAEGFQVECHRSAIDLIRANPQPQRSCIVVDVRMPSMSGLQLQDYLRERSLPIPVILVTANGDISMAVEAMKKGATNFIEKPFRPADLINSVRFALNQVQHSFEQDRLRSDSRDRIKQLNDIELAVLKGVVSGRTNPEIAAELDLSLRTIQFRRTEMMQKLGVASRQELMKLIFEADWTP